MIIHPIIKIIKKRQPPPPPKKRRRTTITNVSNSSQPNGRAEPLDNPDDLPLLSFSDMLFGGQLTSILVCQKCKRVSQTYEEFNDISLSIKAEDYLPHNKKRDRFKKIVGKLTQFPVTEKSEKVRVNLPVVRAPVEMHRSSSVPPSPRPDGEPLGEETPIIGGLRRRSWDAIGSMSDSPELLEETKTTLEANPTKVDLPGEIQEKDREDDVSDYSDVIVNVIGPEDRHVEFVDSLIPNRREASGDSDKEKEAKEPEKEKEKSQDGWAKLGRRISMTVGIGRSRSDKESKKDRERKSRSMDRSGLPPPIKEDVVSDVGMQNSLFAHSGFSLSSTSHDLGATGNRVSLDNANLPSRTISMLPPEADWMSPSSSSPSNSLKPSPPGLIDASSSTPIVGNTPLSQRPSIAPAPSSAHIASTSIFPNVHRSKSPKPPKPTAAETEYLRKILADISSSSTSANPFAIFKPPLIHSHSHARTPLTGNVSSRSGTPISSGEKDKSPSAAAAWLGMGVRSFSGIEDCLRMFTAVEVLDGENMVGCRRCWKIQHGTLQSESKNKDSDEYEEDEEDQPKHSDSPPVETDQLVGIEVDPGRPPPIVEGEKRRRPSLKTLSPSPPVNSFPTSLSTPTISLYAQLNSSDTRSASSLPTAATKDTDGNISSDDSPSPLYLSAAGSESGTRTDSDAEENNGTRQRGPGGLPIPVISTTAPPDAPATTNNSFSSLAAAESQDSASTSKSGPSVPSPHSRLAQALYGDSLSSGSKDSLVIPQLGKPRPQRRKTYSDATTTDDNESSDDDDSDTSVGTAVSADSVVELGSTRTGQQSNQGQAGVDGVLRPMLVSPALTTAVPPPVQQKKLPKPPKPVIMRSAYKRYLIAVPPPVLVIHLKRFQQTTKTPLISFSHGLKKLEDYVSFPEYLDLSPFLAPRKEDYGLGKKKGSKDKESRKVKAKEERCMYRLYAVVVHIGNMVSSGLRALFPFQDFSDVVLILMFICYLARRSLYCIHSSSSRYATFVIVGWEYCY